jgi:hypothetical protein
MLNNAAAEKPGSAEHGDGALVCGGHGNAQAKTANPTQTNILTIREPNPTRLLDGALVQGYRTTFGQGA